MTLSRSVDMLSDPALLEKIDKLRDLNVSQEVALPQLVAVGDQSSGKSSLLESISGIPFPKDQSLCTRFATQITSRRDEKEQVKVCIKAGPYATDAHQKHVESFHMTFELVLDFRVKFLDILKKVNERMGLRTDLSADEGKIFSDDTLKIEVNGPEEDPLTIIDVPGIFRTKTEGTTKTDMKLVKDLVRRYIQSERTIILAVLPSNVDIATQEILELAEEYDKTGTRTIGVLTKPDLVCEPSAQAGIRELIDGKKRPLFLGYYLVRNRGADGGFTDAKELDTFFEQEPWRSLPRNRLGINALKEQLRSQLYEITRREFPKLLQDVNHKIRECKRELDNLGPRRQNEREQRNFLNHVAETFQARVRAALAADYTTDSMFDRYELRLITQVVNITDIFCADFKLGAHSRVFEELDQNETSLTDEMLSETDREETSAQRMLEHLRLLLRETKVDEVTASERAELGDIIVAPEEVLAPHEDFTDWINAVYAKSRGMDLGTFNSNLVKLAFAEQSRKWGSLSKLYMCRVILTVHRFIAGLLRMVLPGESARTQLWFAIVGSLRERYQLAINQATLFIEVEKHKAPYTLNPKFYEGLSKARGLRTAELLRPKARKDTRQYGETQLMVNLDDIATAAESKDNVEHLQEHIHDTLQAYYSLALDRFIDNMFQLPVDYCLLNGPGSPLKVFTTDWVINLEAKELKRIVEEPSTIIHHRSRLVAKIKALEEAVKTLWI